MNNRRALKGAIAAIASAATLGVLAAPALANETSTYNLNGKSVAELAQHGGAQRIAAIGNGNAKNVILFIGDGMGDSEITVARDYLKGANGHFEGLDAVGQPAELGDTNAGTGQYTTFSLGGNSGDSAVGKDDKGSLNANPNPGKLTAVTDSSASGSAWATGTKTYNNAVDVDVYGNPQLNLFELAKAAGKATGNVTTAEIQDATPAVLESHSTERGCYGPQGKTDGSSNDAAKRCLVNQLKENGGIGSISEQLLDTRADVTIGGGSKYFRQTVQGGEYAGKTVWEQAKEMGYQTVENDPAAMNALEYKEGQPVLALMSDGNMPTKFNPSKATAKDPAKDANPTVCTPNADWLGNQGSSLADMTKKALDLLEANPAGNTNGYFLQVEGASIDKQDHAGNACGQIGETDDFDQAIAYAMKNVDLSNTLGLASTSEAQQSLSNDAKTEVKLTDGKYVAESTGFNGDAVLSYELKDKSGNVVAASDSSTPVSGVRVKTAQTTGITLDKVTEGNEYTLTVTGRQSGKTVTVDFQAPARDSSDEKPGDGKNDVIASGKVSNNPKSGVLGNTGAAITIAALAIAMLAAIAMIVKTAKISH